MLRNQPQKAEKKLDDQRGQSHRDVKHSDDQCSDFPAIILPIDVDDREHDEVGVDERDYAAKPTIGPQMVDATGCELRKKSFQKVCGTHAASAPAMSKPPAMSFHTASQSITK